MAADVFDLVRQGYSLVCASSRLARRLRYQYAQLQLRQGRSAWVTPDILTWTAWLQRCWAERDTLGPVTGMLLKPEQQLYIWQQLIAQSGYQERLLQLSATARQALNAWDTARQWQIPIFPEGMSLNEDAYAFHNWSRAYRQYCKDNSLIDINDIPDLLLANRPQRLPGNPIALAGFDDLTPQQQALIDAMTEEGTEIRVLLNEPRNNKVNAMVLPDTREEIRAAAHWCRRLLESGAGDDIGVIVPDLRSIYASVENTFDDVLNPDAILAGRGARARHYSITLGLPLSRYPLISSALDILELGDRVLPLPLLSAVLRSPFLAAAAIEGQGRAQLDACLRKYGEHRMKLQSLEYIAARHLPAHAVPRRFLDMIHRYLELQHSAGARQPLHQWAALFVDLLQCFGWPGERTLDSMEYQTVMEWHGLLETFAALDPLAARLSQELIKMNPDQIQLEDVNKMFEYEKLSRDIDSVDDIEVLKNYAKSYIKLYLKQQEVVSKF